MFKSVVSVSNFLMKSRSFNQVSGSKFWSWLHLCKEHKDNQIFSSGGVSRLDLGLETHFCESRSRDPFLRVSVSKVSGLVSVSKVPGLETEYWKEMVY